MTAEIVMAVASVSGTAIVGIALIRTWHRNGREQRNRDQDLATKQALRDSTVEQSYLAITKRLDHPTHGLEALNTKITNIKAEYGVTLARHDERLTNLEQ